MGSIFLSLFPLFIFGTLECVQAIPGSTKPPGFRFDLWNYLPQQWSDFCTVDYDQDHEVNATIDCYLTAQQTEYWRLADLRASLSSLVNTTGLEVAVKLKCGRGGFVSLPSPFRAPGLVKLTVRNCWIMDKWDDFTTPDLQDLDNWLRVQDIRDGIWLLDVAELDFLTANLDKVTNHYECGQDNTLVYYILANMTHVPIFNIGLESFSTNMSILDPSGMLGSSGANVTNLLAYLNNKTKYYDNDTSFHVPDDDALVSQIGVDNIQSRCVYEHLEIHDESFSNHTSRDHFEFLAKDNTYPQLRLFNFSGIGLKEIPKEFRQSRRRFPGSKLGVIDLSYNHIEELGRIPSYPSYGVPTKIIVRHNNISKLTYQMFENIATIPDFTVDIRDNPIACDCKLKDLLLKMQNDSKWVKGSMPYYKIQISVLRCATPSELKGRTVGSLSVEELSCSVQNADLRPALIVLLVIVVILLVLLTLAVKYRKEVRILMYTRVNILLPCGLPNALSAPSPEKTFDAFVAYAHQDTDWVLDHLVKRLEEPRNTKTSRPCKLCIHQRDFVVGKPILDNIIDSIAASRHTIIVLSNSFVKSGWAMEELEHAYRQSIEERRRHLVVVVLEPVAEADMGAVLRRCCKTFTYIHVADSLFWDRLLYSIHVADNSSKAKKTEASINEGYVSDEEKGTDTTVEPSLPEEFKRSLFLDSMRTISVDSMNSSASDLSCVTTPSQVQIDRPLFETQA